MCVHIHTGGVIFLMAAQVCNDLSWFTAVTCVCSHVDVERQNRFSHLHFISVGQRARVTANFGLQGHRKHVYILINVLILRYVWKNVGTEQLCLCYLQYSVPVEDGPVLTSLIYQHIALLLLVKINFCMGLQTEIERKTSTRSENAVKIKSN